MDLLASEYDDDALAAAEPRKGAGAPAPTLLRASASAVAPPTSTELILASTAGSSAASLGATDRNLPVELMWAPSAGPVQRGGPKRVADGATILGTTSLESFDSSTFERQFRSFSTRGYAADPTGSGAMVGDASKFMADAAALLSPATAVAGVKRPAAAAGLTSAATAGAEAAADGTVRLQGGRAEVRGAVKRARLAGGDTSDVDGWAGPWAAFEGEAETKRSALQLGALTDAHKLHRKAQGYNPDKAGKLGETVEGGPAMRTLPPATATATGAGAAAGGVDIVYTGAVRLGGGAAAAGSSSSSARAGAGDADESDEDDRAGSSGGRSAARSGSAVAATGGAGTGTSSSSAAGDEEGEGDGSGPRKRGDRFDSMAGVDAGAGVAAGAVRTTFHYREEKDYQGRSWIEAPKGVRADGGDHECFLPKKAIHKYTGHSKGVQSIQFMPGTGHLLLSGSMDTKVKIWDTAADRGVRRTYMGHTGAVRQVRFDNNGRRFASVSYDRHTKIWDTETGACITSLTTGKVPICATWYPDDGNNVIMVGTTNRRVVQFDVRTGEQVLEYNYHLDAVNSITFFDDNRRIATTSDDKKVLIWEFNAPVPIKYIADPSMHAISTAAIHPSGEAWAGQSMDNNVVVYWAGERCGLNRRKRFTGHVVAGFACQVNFSPSGQYLVSGDGDGQVWVWDWKSTKMLKKWKAHEGGPAIDVAWHPLQPSWVASCGWDGVIKLWD